MRFTVVALMSAVALGARGSLSPESVKPSTGELVETLTKVKAALASQTAEPWGDLLGLLTNIKSRYVCEDAAATADVAEEKTECDAAAAAAATAATTAQQLVATKTAECAGKDAAVTAKQKQITDAEAAKKIAADAIPGYQTLITEGEAASVTAATNFGKERDETQASIDLVARLTADSANLTLTELGSKLETLPAGRAKEMGGLALVAVKTESALGKSPDVDALKALLTELGQKLEEYRGSLIAAEATRVDAWSAEKTGYEKDITDHQATVNTETANIATYAGELASLQSAASACATEAATLQTVATDAANDSTAAQQTCSTAAATAVALGAERVDQLKTVDDLLLMLQEHEGLAAHVKAAVTTLQAQTVADFVCQASAQLALRWESRTASCTHADQGNEGRYSTSGTVLECADACDANAKCKGFSYKVADSQCFNFVTKACEAGEAVAGLESCEDDWCNYNKVFPEPWPSQAGNCQATVIGTYSSLQLCQAACTGDCTSCYEISPEKVQTRWCSPAHTANGWCTNGQFTSCNVNQGGTTYMKP